MEEKGGDPNWFPKTQRDLGVSPALDPGPLQPQTLDPWVLAKASRCSAGGGGVLIFSVFEHLTTEFSFHYMECLSHWLRSHLTTILCIVGFDRPRGGCKWGVMFRQAGQAGPDCGAGKLEQ